MREVKVRYANNKTEIKSVYGIVTVEICGRAGEFNVLAEPMPMVEILMATSPNSGYAVLRSSSRCPDKRHGKN